VRLIENDMEAGPNVTQIEQPQMIIGFEIKRLPDVLNRGAMIADPR